MRQQLFNKNVEDEVEIKQNYKNNVRHTLNWELVDQHLSLYSRKILLNKNFKNLNYCKVALELLKGRKNNLTVFGLLPVVK